MAPLPANQTPVFFVDYSVGGREHTVQFRGRLGSTASELAAVAQSFLQQIDSMMFTGWTVLGTRFRPAASVISLPSVPITGVTPGGGAEEVTTDPRFLSWVGRGVSTGRRVRVYLYGLAFSNTADFRLQEGEIAAVDSARAVLISGSESVLATIGNDEPLWNNYANIGYNSYWERAVRG